MSEIIKKLLNYDFDGKPDVCGSRLLNKFNMLEYVEFEDKHLDYIPTLDVCEEINLKWPEDY